MYLNSNSRFLIRLIVDILLLISVYCVALLILPQLMKTHERGFFCGDDTLSYPYKQYTILKRLHITILVIGIPATLVLCVEMLRVAFPNHKTNSSSVKSFLPKRPQRYIFVGINIPTFVSECYSTMGIYLFGLALLLIVTGFTKASIGRLAPYFFEVCQPLLTNNQTACRSRQHFGVYIENYSCSSLTSSDHLLTIMRQSFPSTQSAASAYAMLFVVIYLQAHLRVRWLILWRTILQVSALLLSFMVGIERVTSYRHHWTDVFAGYIIGCSLALFMTHSLLQLFQNVPIKARRAREEATDIYGYYTIMPRPVYSYF